MILPLLAANFASNETLVAFSEYIHDGLLASAGSSYMLGLIFLILVVVACLLSSFSLDSSAYVIFLTIMVLSFWGLLPQAVFIVSLVIAGAVVAWVFYRAVRT